MDLYGTGQLLLRVERIDLVDPKAEETPKASDIATGKSRRLIPFYRVDARSLECGISAQELATDRDSQSSQLR